MIQTSTIQRKMSNTYINTYITGYNFLYFIVHIENIPVPPVMFILVPPVMFIGKFSVVSSFRNLKNADINILGCEIYFTIFITFSTPDNLQSYNRGYR